MHNRVLGTETEYGIFEPENPQANAIALSTEAVETYASVYRGDMEPVMWDYRGEDPLNDVRGMRLDRAAADPSMLTDDPYHLAPSGGEERLPKPTDAERRLLRPSSIVLPNGGRFYVDHAHPEYSSPETLDAMDGVLWDRAGDKIAKRVMALRKERGASDIVFVKNNVDGKGATYGAHENYQVPRSTELDHLIRFSIPYLVTRQIFSASGRVGVGQRSERAAFQISQRADYVENDIGLETTFNRPIFNTRDEPHAVHHDWRRIHVIGGDANLFDMSIFLKLGVTELVFWALEQDPGLAWDSLDIDNPVEAVKEVSQDPTLKRTIKMRSGLEWTALDLQKRYLELVLDAVADTGVQLSAVQQRVLAEWDSVLAKMTDDVFSVATDVEWVGKYALFSRQRERLETTWDDPRIVAMDLQWGDLRPERSLVGALDRAGAVRRLFAEDEVAWAADNPPQGTRAGARGAAVMRDPGLVGASWTSLVYDASDEHALRRVPLPTAAN